MGKQNKTKHSSGLMKKDGVSAPRHTISTSWRAKCVAPSITFSYPDIYTHDPSEPHHSIYHALELDKEVAIISCTQRNLKTTQPSCPYRRTSRKCSKANYTTPSLQSWSETANVAEMHANVSPMLETRLVENRSSSGVTSMETLQQCPLHFQTQNKMLLSLTMSL